MKPESQHPRLAYRRGGKGRLPALGNALSLKEVVILRRLRDGQRQVDIARDCGFTQNQVSNHLGHARRRFAVADNDELLALPRVQEQLDDGTEAQS